MPEQSIVSIYRNVICRVQKLNPGPFAPLTRPGTLLRVYCDNLQFRELRRRVAGRSLVQPFFSRPRESSDHSQYDRSEDQRLRRGRYYLRGPLRWNNHCLRLFHIVRSRRACSIRHRFVGASRLVGLKLGQLKGDQNRVARASVRRFSVPPPLTSRPRSTRAREKKNGRSRVSIGSRRP